MDYTHAGNLLYTQYLYLLSGKTQGDDIKTSLIHRIYDVKTYLLKIINAIALNLFCHFSTLCFYILLFFSVVVMGTIDLWMSHGCAL